MRNRDAATPANLELDALSSPEIGRYRSGAWLMASAELPGVRSDDVSAVAELSARVRIEAARLLLEDKGDTR
jgi:hypothetical protein